MAIDETEYPELKNAPPTGKHTKRRVVKSELEQAEHPEAEGPTYTPPLEKDYPSRKLK